MAILLQAQSERRVRILLTGFGRFPGVPTNPSAAIAAEIARTGRRRLAHCGIEIMSAVFPVEFDKVEAALARELAAAKPDAVVHLGLAGRRSVLTVETRAKNRISQLHPDAAKRWSTRSRIIAGADVHRARLPAARLVATMRRTGAPARLSNDAGDYICNATLYLSLASALPLAGFIHVPWPRRADQPLSRRRGRAWRPSHEAMVRAVAAALLLIGMETRRHRALTRRKTEAESSG